MSVEGRDEPLERLGKLPAQGGPADSPTDGPTDGSTGGPTGAERPSSVPQQRQREGDGQDSVLPPPRSLELPPSDAELIQQMRDGADSAPTDSAHPDTAQTDTAQTDSAYAELFRRHADAVRRYARTCCRDAHTADDLTAEVFARTLQAVRGGAGPQQAVRAYLLTTVRHVAATWTKSAKREQLVEDFALFADQAARSSSSEVSDQDTLDLGADVRAMQIAEQSLAMEAFRSLPERWQAVLWHTTVEKESPSEVAPLFGLTANATAVLAGRAREGLKQAYLQAHVNQALTGSGDCARYADRLGAYARGGLRMRAERGLRKHLEECAKCRVAAGELKDVNAGIPALVPVAVIGWFAGGSALKAAGLAGGVAGAAGAGAASATGGGSAGGGAAASEGLGAPVKAGIAAGVVVAAAAGLAFALAGSDAPPRAKPEAAPPAAQPVSPPAPTTTPPSPRPKPPPPPPAPAPPRTPAPKPTAEPTPPKRAPEPTPEPAPPKPPPSEKPVPPKPSPKPPLPAPTVYRVNRLSYSLLGQHTAPEIDLGGSSWVWQRGNLRVDRTTYDHGITVHTPSSVTIELNRRCSTYQAFAGIDDLSLGLGSARFSVYGDGTRLWRSEVLHGGDPAVPVTVGIAGRSRIRLVVERGGPLSSVGLADWAQSQISCG
ncbi:sigma-70 family RNA polymerase sigma factor [Streptomyces sp. NPDC051322]|uniref:sigma-70 family RNA polymerase sigma factor n=1 Tax=Streptomyces sp. NPDC051322 TaxID=3154645 RepID=UPI00344E76D2